MFDIRPAQTKEDYALTRTLFVEYADWLEVDLCFQNFDDELENIEKMYGPPGGQFLLIRQEGEPAGCVALRRWDKSTCEMRRLYIRPQYRGAGLGRICAEAILNAARDMGYTAMRLDTLPSMTRAISLYRSMGFREVAPCDKNPIEGAIYMELPLNKENP